MTMDVKGITWVGNIYQKFENMCLEVEEVMLEDTVKYIENQMQTVGESVKKIYSEVMQDLLPPSSHDLDEKVASELPIEKHADNGSFEKTFQGSEEITVKADTSETTEDSRITRDVDNHEIHDESSDGEAFFKSAFSDSNVFENNSTSHARQINGNTDVESNLGVDENQQNMETPALKTVAEVTLLESDACSTSQSCELPKENQNHADTVSKPASSAEVTRPVLALGTAPLVSKGQNDPMIAGPECTKRILQAVEVLCSNEIEKESTEPSSNVLSLVKSADEKDACSTSQSCELPKENQNHADIVSKPASSAEVTRPVLALGTAPPVSKGQNDPMIAGPECTKRIPQAVEVLCSNEIEKESTEPSSNVLSLVKSADEKEIHTSYFSSSVISGDTNGFSMIKTIQPDDCSHNTVVASHPEIKEGWSMDTTMIDSILDHNQKMMQQDHELKLEESCVMVASDEFQLVPKTCGNLQINKFLKKKRQQPFSLSMKSARKQEYEDLAIWYEKNEKFKCDNVENLCPTSSVKDKNKLLLADISDAEWELL